MVNTLSMEEIWKKLRPVPIASNRQKTIIQHQQIKEGYTNAQNVTKETFVENYEKTISKTIILKKSKDQSWQGRYLEYNWGIPLNKKEGGGWWVRKRKPRWTMLSTI